MTHTQPSPKDYEDCADYVARVTELLTNADHGALPEANRANLNRDLQAAAKLADTLDAAAAALRDQHRRAAA